MEMFKNIISRCYKKNNKCVNNTNIIKLDSSINKNNSNDLNFQENEDKNSSYDLNIQENGVNNITNKNINSNNILKVNKNSKIILHKNNKIRIKAITNPKYNKPNPVTNNQEIIYIDLTKDDDFLLQENDRNKTVTNVNESTNNHNNPLNNYLNNGINDNINDNNEIIFNNNDIKTDKCVQEFNSKDSQVIINPERANIFSTNKNNNFNAIPLANYLNNGVNNNDIINNEFNGNANDSNMTADCIKEFENIEEKNIIPLNAYLSDNDIIVNNEFNEIILNNASDNNTTADCVKEFDSKDTIKQKDIVPLNDYLINGFNDNNIIVNHEFNEIILNKASDSNVSADCVKDFESKDTMKVKDAFPLNNGLNDNDIINNEFNDNANYNNMTADCIKEFNEIYDNIKTNINQHSNKVLNDYKENEFINIDLEIPECSITSKDFLKTESNFDNVHSNDVIIIDSEESDDTGYNSSDFEFITEEEAKRGGLINKRKRNFKERPNFKLDTSYRENHKVPENNDFLNLFNGAYCPAMMGEIHFMENKSVKTRHRMLVEFDGIGFDRGVPRMSSDNEFKHEAKESADMIRFMYPRENKRRRKSRY